MVRVRWTPRPLHLSDSVLRLARMSEMSIIWKPLWEWAKLQPASSWDWVFLRIVLWVMAVAALLKALQFILEQLAKGVENWKKLGLPVTSRSARLVLRRRQQFARVLAGDLLALGKAENWNDQFFVDLEAEVEVEGRYYTSALRRMFHRHQGGLRRVPSLMDAIESSADQLLLVVGDPGSGKSVALRHLAHQMATKAARSNRVRRRIPLYINLREIPETAAAPTADFVKGFVIDSVRRGDADTADYVREHWDSYRDEGIWFFAFDSFDEIPAVMHAPAGSAVVREYAEAIRRFTTSMGDCGGVIASREFRAPDCVGWQKIRILPLSESKQQMLVGASFLTDAQHDLVLKHIALTGTLLAQNPMLLALLCRYVRDHGYPPQNDHELLYRHIEKLASRDSDYIASHYRLKPSNLLDGATQLACLFARSEGIGLSPTRDDIVADYPASLGIDLDRLLAALVEVKICRSDVKEARPGDRRYAFSHRRYQEVLFVRYVIGAPQAITPETLLTDARYHDYTVALLETQDSSVTRNIYDEAAKILRRHRLGDAAVQAGRPFGKLHYFQWTEEPECLVLRAIAEGAAARPSDVPSDLRHAVRDVIEPRWKTGDFEDWRKCLSYIHLLPEPACADLFRATLKMNLGELETELFGRIHVMPAVPIGARDWIRRRLSEEILLATNRATLLRTQAMAGRLPSKIGADWITKRCLRLRSAYIVLGTWPAQFVSRVCRLFSGTTVPLRQYAPALFILNLAYIAALFIPLLRTLYRRLVSTGKMDLALPVSLLATFLYIVVLGRLLAAYLLCDYGRPGKLSILLGRARLLATRCLGASWRARWFLLATLVIALAPGFVLHGYASRWTWRGAEAGVFYAAGMMFDYVLGMIIMAVVLMCHSIARSRNLKTLQAGRADTARSLDATSAEELSYWLDHAPERIAGTPHDCRSLLCGVTAYVRGELDTPPGRWKQWAPSHRDLTRLVTQLLTRARAIQ